MIWRRKVKHGISQQNHQFFIFTKEQSGQRIILRLDDDAIPDPLPKLSLRCPKLLSITANYQRISLLGLYLFLFFILRFRHDFSFHTSPCACRSPSGDYGEKAGGTPQGSLVFETAITM